MYTAVCIHYQDFNSIKIIHGKHISRYFFKFVSQVLCFLRAQTFKISPNAFVDIFNILFLFTHLFFNIYIDEIQA